MPDSQHAIRLRGPWLYQIMEAGEGTGSAEAVATTSGGTCTVPTRASDLVTPGFVGRIRFERSFHCPTGLRAGNRVRLVVHGFDRVCRLALNGVSLPATPASSLPISADVTPWLLPRNTLSVEVLVDPGGPDRIGEGRLEIDETKGTGVFSGSKLTT